MPDHIRSFPDVATVVMGLVPSYPIYCVRPTILERRAKRFMTLFPGTVLYAVKCNPHRLVLNALHRAGIRHFDTASLGEIAQVSENFDDADCYFMHPVKSRAVIKSAYRVYGVRTFVVDHINELRKIIDETGGDDLIIVVRIKTPSEGALYHLSSKFGAELDEAAALLKEAARQGCETGISFHVGSQCREPQAFSRALALAGQVLEAAGVELTCLDVGGGFPSRYVNMDAPPLEDFMEEIRAGLRALKLKPTVEVMAEPGRSLVATGCSLITQVQLRKDKQLYINDGIYGSLSETVQGGVTHPVRLVRIDDDASETMDQFILNGPTCDSLDVLPGTYELPTDVREGDWIEIDCVGAYSNALATNFNGFYPETFVEVFDDPPLADYQS